MFKTISQIKKKIIAAAMAAAILVSGNIGTSSVNPGNHSLTGKTVTVSAKKIVLYFCPYCDEFDDNPFRSEDKFNKHLSSKHRIIYDIDTECPYCGYSTTNQTALNSHKQTCSRKIHTYPHECIYKTHGCSLKSFASYANYKYHIEKECPYKNKCRYCGKSLIVHNALDKLTDTSYADEHVASCKKNPYRQISEEKKLELKNSGFRIPTWNMEDENNPHWECPYDGCKATYPDGSLELCVKHIQCVHPLDAYFEKLEFNLNQIIGD